MRRAQSRPIRVRVHERGNRRLDGILALIEEAARPRPLPEVLAHMCLEVAGIARSDVVSVYVREPGSAGDVLVMRATVGLSASAVGNVRLAPGEGLTGMVAECMRPISVAVARDQAHYKHFPGIGEEHFPSYLGVPLLVGGKAAGVLVLQRRAAREFSPAETAMAAALAAPFAFALERARSRSEDHRVAQSAPSRSVRLQGTAVAGGVAMGRAELLPGLEEDEPPSVTAADAVARAFRSLSRSMEKARRQVEPAMDSDALRQLRSLAVVLEDRRLRELALGECTRGGVGRGLRKVALEYARVPYRLGGGDASSWLAERSADIEDLCLLLASRARGVRVPSQGAVLVAERLTSFVALAAVGRRAAAVVLGGPSAGGHPATAVARAAGIPVVADVAGLFAWARPGDRVIVDGDAGLVRVNPPVTAIARYRNRRLLP